MFVTLGHFRPFAASFCALSISGTIFGLYSGMGITALRDVQYNIYDGKSDLCNYAKKMYSPPLLVHNKSTA